MKKANTVLIMILFVIGSIFAGKFSSLTKPLMVYETKYFDIIYPSESIHAATILKDNADFIYETIINDFHIKNTRHIPVVITNDIQSINAYFTALPYTRIVMFDTITYGNFLDINSDSFLAIFEHELTHALTLTVLDDIWYRPLSDVFSDQLNIQPLNISMAFAEGLAVSQESYRGQGRVNDPFYNSYIIQSIIDDNAPDFDMIQGYATIATNISLPYIFGSGFIDFIRNRWGSRKLGQYIKETQKIHYLPTSISLPFRNIYNENIYDIYDKYLNSIKIPELSNIVKEDIVKKGSYSNLTSDGTTLYYKDKSRGNIISIDTTSNKSNVVASDVSNSTYHYFSVNNNVITSDGIFNSPLEKTYFTEFNHENTNYEIDNFRLVSYFNSDNFVGLYNEGQVYKIALLNKETKDKTIFELREKEKVLYVKTKNEAIYYTSRLGNEYFINVINKGNRSYVKLPDNIKPGYFNIVGNEIVFEYGTKNNLIRVAIFNLDTNILFLGRENISGSLYNPTIINDYIYFISSDLYYSKICKTKRNSITYDKVILDKKILDNLYVPKEIQEILGSKRYNPFKYLIKGILLPYIYPTNMFNGFISGLEYITSDPVENVFISIGGKIKYYNKNVYSNVHLSLQGITGARRYNFSTEFNFDTLKNFSAASKLIYQHTWQLHQNKNIKLSLANFNRYDSRLYNAWITYTNIDSLAYSYFNEKHNNSKLIYELKYYKLKQYGLTKYNILGYVIGLYNETTFFYSGRAIKQTNSIYSMVNLPGLYNCNSKVHTYNFPLNIINEFTFNGLFINYKGTYSNDNYYILYNKLNMSLLLYAYQIQKSLPYTPFFINDVSFSLKYNNVYVDYLFPTEKIRMQNKLYLRTKLNFCLNRMNNYKMSLTGEFGYNFEAKSVIFNIYFNTTELVNLEKMV